MHRFDALKYLTARMHGCDYAMSDEKPRLRPVSFRLDEAQLLEVDRIATQCGLSRARTMVLLVQLGLDEFLFCLPESLGGWADPAPDPE